MVHPVWSTVETDMRSTSLAAFAEAPAVGANRRVVLVIGGAVRHTTRNVRVPRGVHLVFFPPYPPEIQPAERLFPLLHDAIAHRRFQSIEHLLRVLAARIGTLDPEPLRVAEHSRFHGWQRTKCRLQTESLLDHPV